MVTADREYNPYKCFAVYAGIARRSIETIDIKYDTIYLCLFFSKYKIWKYLSICFRLDNPNRGYFQKKKGERE